MYHTKDTVYQHDAHMHSLGGIPSAGSLCQDTAFCPHFLDTVLRSARFESLGAFEIILGRRLARCAKSQSLRKETCEPHIFRAAYCPSGLCWR
jgi:hypothetical protein